MKIDQDIAFINQLENQFPVDGWTIDGIHIWPLIRIPLAFALNRQNSQAYRFAAKSHKASRAVKRAAGMLTGAVRQVGASITDREHNYRSHGPADVLFVKSASNRLLRLPNGMHYDIHCDPIIDILQKQGKEVATLEISPRHEYLLPRYDKTKFIQAQLDYIIFTSRIDSWFPGQAGIKADYYEQFVSTVKSQVPDISLPTLGQLSRQVKTIHNAAEYFATIITEKEIKCAMTTNYASFVGFSLNLACRHMGIPSVDLQHGVSGELHPSYGRWTKVPTSGYELLPAVFWCWSEDDASAITNWNGPVKNHHRPIIGGNAWAQLWLDDENEIVAYYDDLYAKSALGRPIDTAIRILVTLQTGGLIPPVVLQTIKASPASWHWLIRFHPYMTEAERADIIDLLTKECFQANIEFELSSSLPIMALLRHSDVLLTEWSATVIDAKALGVPSIVVHPYGEEYFRKEIDQGWVKSAYTPAAVVEAIIQQAHVGKFSTIDHHKETLDTSNIAKVFRDLFDTKYQLKE